MVLDIQGGDATNKVPASCAAAIAVGDGVESGSGQATAVGGVNSEAVNAMLSFCESLLEFAERAGPEEPDMPPPTLTANPAIISRDENRLTLEFEVRPPPSLQLDTVRNELRRIIAAQQTRFPSFKFELIEIRANPGFRSKMDCEIVSLTAAAMAAAHLSIEFAAKKGCTEAGIYAAAGFEPLVFGPGPSVGVIHAPDEYNLLSEVEGAIRFYEALLTQ
jgi:acetylornithine deacetylase/succinyl-diaminopimelate desuccinylase-like protein